MSAPAESLDHPPEIAIGGGYYESKWVTEQLFRRAAKSMGLRTTSVRVGQVSGDQRIGGWSASEWVPALVRISERLGCIPSRDEVRGSPLRLSLLISNAPLRQDVTWVPVDVVASALLEMTGCDEPVLHIVSPRPVRWDTVVRPIAARLGLRLVPYAEWLTRVEESAANAHEHDAAHNLLAFFRDEGMRLAVSTEKAVRCSTALASMRPLRAEDGEKWVEFWRSIGFLQRKGTVQHCGLCPG